MAVKKGQRIELEITDIAFGGKGLGRVDGMAVFVDQAVPLDRVAVRIIRRKKQYAEARIEEMLEASPYRVQPPCRYSGVCGGCKWQFLDYDKQLEYKRRHVLDSMEHIALIKDVTVHPTIASASRFEYRNKMEFTCADKRWLMPDEMGRCDIDDGFALGLHVPGTFHKVLDTASCLLHPALGNDLLQDVRHSIRTSGVPVYGLRTHEGFWRFLMLRHSVAYDQWMVNIITKTQALETVQPVADMLTEKYPQVVSVVNNITARESGVAIGDYEMPLAGASSLRDKIGKYEFEISANSFFQTNTRGAQRLYETVKAYAELNGNENVLDLYCGTGTIAICLSDSAREVTGIEIVESAVTDAITNCQINGIPNCRFIAGDIKDCLSKVNERPDVMIIDPPRAGMHKDVVRQVLDMAPGRIVYVSCNPSTMARDIGMMKDYYRVREIQPVDMFPHTYHIESVARLDKVT